MILSTTVSLEGRHLSARRQLLSKTEGKKIWEGSLTATGVKEKSLIDLNGQEDWETDCYSFHVLKDLRS